MNKREFVNNFDRATALLSAWEDNGRTVTFPGPDGTYTLSLIAIDPLVLELTRPSGEKRRVQAEG